MAELSWETKEKPTTIKGANYNRWNENIGLQRPTFELPYHHLEDIGTVFIYLV
jgi:hypothetical protein